MSSLATDDPMIVDPDASDEALLIAINQRLLNIYTVARQSDDDHCVMYERLAEEALNMMEVYTDRHAKPPTPEQLAAFENSQAAYKAAVERERAADGEAHH